MPQVPKRNPSLSVNRTSVPKASDVLAEQLRETILRGEVPEGGALPTEREFVTQTGLTRGAVREALRTLAVEGLIQTRHGRFGGSVVTLPGNDSMASAIDLFVKGRKLPLRTLRETREALEPLLARWAAERRTDENLKELRSLHEDLVASVANFQEFSVVNVEWHNAVARAGGNGLLAAVLYSVSHGVYVSTTTEEYDTPETRKQVIHIHSRINDAIEARNADLAERSMRQHIVATHARPVASVADSVPLSEKKRIKKEDAATK